MKVNELVSAPALAAIAPEVLKMPDRNIKQNVRKRIFMVLSIVV
jgi:hypothetical protein